MENRIDYYKTAESATNLMMEMEKLLKKTSIDRKLRELVKIRVSQINGCAYCIAMHTNDARKMKVTEEEIYLLNAWNDTNIYTDKEKLAFELAEHITLIAEKKVEDDLYLRVRTAFNEQEYTDLVLIINQINMWNRLSISMGNKHLV